jgi:uncharacterized protein YeeX (DUF496 family)
METCLKVKINSCLIERLEILAANKSKIIGKNVSWEDIFNQIYNHAIKQSVNDMIEDQLIENINLVEEKSKIYKDLAHLYERKVVLC